VLDPSEGRANEFAEPRGLSRDQVEQAIAAVRERFDVRATMLAAFDPAADPSGRAARAALALARILQEV
jgi:arginase family enzyme